MDEEIDGFGCMVGVLIFALFGGLCYFASIPTPVTVKGKWWRTYTSLVRYEPHGGKPNRYDRVVVREAQATGAWHDPVVWNDLVPAPLLGETVEKTVEYSVALVKNDGTEFPHGIDDKTYNRIKIGGHYWMSFVIGEEILPEGNQ